MKISLISDSFLRSYPAIYVKCLFFWNNWLFVKETILLWSEFTVISLCFLYFIFILNFIFYPLNLLEKVNLNILTFILNFQIHRTAFNIVIEDIELSLLLNFMNNTKNHVPFLSFVEPSYWLIYSFKIFLCALWDIGLQTLPAPSLCPS